LSNPHDGTAHTISLQAERPEQAGCASAGNQSHQLSNSNQNKRRPSFVLTRQQSQTETNAAIVLLTTIVVDLQRFHFFLNLMSSTTTTDGTPEFDKSPA
jgi:hypothetical protein